MRGPSGHPPHSKGTSRQWQCSSLRSVSPSSVSAHWQHSAAMFTQKYLCDRLIGAAFAGDVAAFSDAMDLGADLQAASDWTSMTPLHHACERGHVHVVRLALQNGNPHDEFDTRGLSPALHAAGAIGDDVDVSCLYPVSPSPSPSPSPSSVSLPFLTCCC